MAKKSQKQNSNYRCKDCLFLGKDNPKFLRVADRSPILAECLVNKPFYTNKMRIACDLFKPKYQI
jgi:hypothetical protein